MDIIDIKSSTDVLSILKKAFPEYPICEISNDILKTLDGDIIYNYFYGRSWVDICNNVDLIKDNGVLEMGAIFLEKKELWYYVPLYIYATILDKNYTFGDAFLAVLTPCQQSEDAFDSFVHYFNDEQLKIMAQFVFYLAKLVGKLDGEDAYKDFWELYF